jgi:hypothetical protein
VEKFFFKVLGVHVNISRVRMIMHTACQSSQSSKSLESYQRADTHSSAVADMHYLKLSAAEIAKDSSIIHDRLLQDEKEVEGGVAPAPALVPAPALLPMPAPALVPMPAPALLPAPAQPSSFCGHCGAASNKLPFCGHCGAQLKRGAPSSSTHTPPRKRGAHLMEEEEEEDGSDNSQPSLIPVTLSPPGKRRHVKVPWLRAEVEWVRDWVAANPAAPDSRGRLTFRWSRCALDGAATLQAAHRKGTHVRACYRTLLQGSYTELLAKDGQGVEE